MFVATLLKQLIKISNGFSDLVLGPLPADGPAITANDGNQPYCVSISKIAEFVGQLVDYRGQIVEVSASEPEHIDEIIDALIRRKEMGPSAILGIEKNRFQEIPGASMVMVMPSQKAPEMLFAAQELLKSQAIQLIVLSEILLKEDARCLIRELTKLKALVSSSEALLVLLNPNTSERRLIMSELQLICSRQFELGVARYSKESNKV